MSEVLKIGVTGCQGRVGALLVQTILGHELAELAGGTERFIPSDKPDFFMTDKPEELFQRSDVVIDFTPGMSAVHAQLAADHDVPLVIGTTGLSDEEEQALRDASQTVPIMYTANMAMGVNMLMALVEQAAAKLHDEWDIDIFEIHHNQKIDSPSGTALALGKSAAQGRGINHDPVIDRNGKREKGSIGYSVARGGDVIGEHTVYFCTEGERIELTHKSNDRGLYAKGAVKAALWIKNQPPALYSMRDVLGL